MAPGADSRAIELAFEGAGRLEIDGQGNLVLRMGDGQVTEQAPAIYQEMNAVNNYLDSIYSKNSQRRQTLATTLPSIASFDTGPNNLESKL